MRTCLWNFGNWVCHVSSMADCIFQSGDANSSSLAISTRSDEVHPALPSTHLNPEGPCKCLEEQTKSLDVAQVTTVWGVNTLLAV